MCGTTPTNQHRTLRLSLQTINLPFRPIDKGTLIIAEIVHLNIQMVFVGICRSDEDDARSEYHIHVRAGQRLVSARDYIDGELHVVANVTCDQQWAEFDTLMASTSRADRVTLILRIVR